MEPATRLKIAAALAAQLVLLVLPLVVVGELRAVADPRVAFFLVAGALLFLADREAGHDAGRYSWSAAATALGMLLTFWVGLAEYALEWSTPGVLTSVAGVLLLAGGIALRWIAVRALGPRFISTVPAKGGELVTRGIYAWMHHPSEVGNLLICAGTAALFGSLLATTTFIVLVPLVAARVRREERLLLRNVSRRW